MSGKRKQAASAPKVAQHGATKAKTVQQPRVPDDIRRNTYTRDRKPGLHTRVLGNHSG